MQQFAGVQSVRAEYLTAEIETWLKMRVLMIAGMAGKAAAGVAEIVYNVTNELRKLEHTVKPLFFDDLLPKTRWPRRFRTVEFAAAIARAREKVPLWFARIQSCIDADLYFQTLSIS